MAEAEAAERVLVLTPTGRDAQVTCDALAAGGIACDPCADLAETLQKAEAGAGAILLADEAFAPDGLALLGAALERQEAWSDLPILIATTEAGSRGVGEQIRRHLSRTGSITVLQRPIPLVTLLTSVRVALRSRRRQYQLRDLLAELERKTQGLEQARELRERFVAILAHDLRGPLSTISAGMNLMAQAALPPKERTELVRRTARNITQMDRMIRDLLDVHRIEAGRPLPLHLDRCDLGEVAREVAEELNAAHGERFVVRAEEGVEGVWSADDLRRALWNLGTNAVKYGAPDRPIEIAVHGTRHGARVDVHNEGPPIAPENQAALFEPFRRTVSSERSPQGGWGLGLALVRGCAEAHGGTVEVRSAPETGTTFTIRLPWDARPHQAAQDASGSDNPHQPQPR